VPPVELSIVVLSWNTRELTLACLGALARDTAAGPREVVVIDNASEDGSAEAIAAAFPDVRLVRNAQNAGYARGNNQGVALAQGAFVLLLNSDTEVRPGAVDRLVAFLKAHPGHGAVGPKLVNPDGSVQKACQRFPGLLTALCFDTWIGRLWPGTLVERRYHYRDFDHLGSRDVEQPPGACFLMRTAEYRELGGFDEGLWLFFNDVDLCRRIWRRGRRIHYLAEAEVLHHGGASTKRFASMVVTWHRNRLAYYRKQYGVLAMPYLRAIVRMRALEEWLRARKKHADLEDVRKERAFLRQCVAEILAP
jgi:GT2 family glycosyltransferase